MFHSAIDKELYDNVEKDSEEYHEQKGGFDNTGDIIHVGIA